LDWTDLDMPDFRRGEGDPSFFVIGYPSFE